MSKYTEKNIPDGLFVKVRHYNERNSDSLNKLGIKWYTEAYLCERGEDKHSYTALSCGLSSCSLKDNPSRKIGRAIAVGRALKNYYEKLEVEKICNADSF